MILIDTNILIEIYRNNAQVIENVKNVGQENLAISDVTCAELLFGARNKIELQTIRKDLNKLFVLPIQSAISKLSVDLVEKYSLSQKLSLPDALIASTAIIHDLELYTLNLKDFRLLKEVNLYNVRFD